MTIQCYVTGCTKDATGLPTLNIPAAAMPIAEHDPIQIILKLPLCDQHHAITKPEHFITDELAANVRAVVGQRNAMQPDFSRAFLTIADPASDEWKQLHAEVHPDEPKTSSKTSDPPTIWTP